MNTGIAKSSGAHNENGPSSLYDSVGRRKTPEPTTALMHIATRPPKPTARTSFTGWSVLMLFSLSPRFCGERVAEGRVRGRATCHARPPHPPSAPSPPKGGGEGYFASYPPPRRPRPGSAFVIAPSRNTSSPFTI